MGIRSELETLFEQDVHLVRLGALDASRRENVLRERVMLHGAA